MGKKLYTIWRYALLFADKESDFEDEYPNSDVGFLYIGHVDEIPYEIAEKIAEYHPNCYEYFESSMVSLYKGYRHLKGGTENAKMAIVSLSDKKFVYIKQILDEERYYPEI